MCGFWILCIRCSIFTALVWLSVSERVYRPADSVNEDTEDGWRADSCVASRILVPHSNSSASRTIKLFEAFQLSADNQVSWLMDGSHVASGSQGGVTYWRLAGTIRV